MLRISAQTAIVIASLLFVSLGTASAEQHVVFTPEGEKVVHTRLAPVMAHRIVPPYYGKHVYSGRRR